MKKFYEINRALMAQLQPPTSVADRLLIGCSSVADRFLTMTSLCHHLDMTKIWKSAAAIALFLCLGVGEVWGAISEQDVPSSTFTCGTTSGYATYFYTFSADAANSDTIVFSAYDSYDSSITWASFTGAHGGSSSSWNDKIYAAASGTPEVGRNATPSGLSHKVYNSGNYYQLRSTRTLRYLVTNCSGAMISGYTSNSSTIYLKAYLVTAGTPASSAAQSASLSNSTQTVASISSLSASNTYLIEVSGSVDQNYHMLCEVAFIYPHSGGGSTYSITYNCNDATSGCPSNVAAATNLPNPLPSAPTKTGYTFGGWYTNEGLTDAAVAGASLEANATLYAKWCANHTVSWVVNGSAYSTGSPTTSTNECDGITTMPTAPADGTLSGCANSFRGWSETNLYGAAGQSAPADLFRTAAEAPTIDDDKTFYAVFGTGTDAAYVNTVLWSEDWTGATTANSASDAAKPSAQGSHSGKVVYSGSVTYSEDSNGTYVRNQGDAGGSAPELMIKASSGTWTISGIPNEKAKSLTLTYRNKQTVQVDVSGTGYTLTPVTPTTNANKGDTWVKYTSDGFKEVTILCGSASTFSLTFSATTSNNVRLDDIVVKIKEDGAADCRCICPSWTVTPELVTASTPIFITSAASKTVRSQDSLLIVGSGLQKSATLSISSPASKFELKSRTYGALTTDATGSIDAVGYIYYTPDAGDTSDGLDKNESFTISDGTNTKTVSTALIGRHLPTDFVIAAKNGDTWYALPADKTTGTYAPVAITVDNATTPTSASTDDNNVYTLYGQTSKIVNQGEGQYVKLAMHGQSNAPLYGQSSSTGIGKSSATVVTNDQSVDYWWALTQKNTSITNSADAKYNVSVANGNTSNPLKIWLNAGGTGVPKWGLYSSASNIITEIRLIPVCTAPTSPSITGTTAYTAGGDISLTASATGTISGVTTYQWYKGDPDDSGVSQGDASTSGATFTKASCVVGDAGTYYCVISNGACTVKVSQAITVSCATAPLAVTSLTCSAQTSSSLTYTWTKASNASGYVATLYPDEDCEETPVETKNLGDVATVTFETGLSASTTYYCKIQSKGNGTVYCEDGGTTSAVGGTTSAAAVLYTITYSAGASATCKSSDTQASAGADIALATPTWSDHTFLGWYVGDTKIGDAGDDYAPTADITIYGAWKEDCAGGSTTLFTFTVNGSGDDLTVERQGGTLSLTTSNTFSTLTGGTVTAVNANTSSGSAEKMVGTDSKERHIRYTNTAQYLTLALNSSLAQGDVISFTSNANNQIYLTKTTTYSSSIATSSKSYTIPSNSPLIGESTIYVWASSTSVRIQTFTITRPGGGGGTCYYVTYDGNGAEDGLTCDPTAYAANDDPVVLNNGGGGAAYTKDGYTFTGWNTEDDGTGDPYDADDVIENISENVILYAQWSSGDGYSITYHCNDATSGCPSNATEQTTLPNPFATPTKTNYTFGGWYTDAALSSVAVAGATLSANADLYAKWTQTVTLNTGSQGSGAAKTPTVVWQATALTGFIAHTADGYTLQGYYTAGSGGTKVLNADGTFAGSNVTDYITSSKWSRTGAAPTLYAQWLAASDCSTSDFVIKKGSSEQYQGCMESSSYNGTATSFTAGSATTVGDAKMTISSYSDGAITRPGSGNTFSIVIEPVSGYYLSSICWAGKVENDETVYYYWDDNTAGKVTISSQTTSGTGVTYDAPNSSTTKFTAYYVDDGDGSGGIWWRNVQVEVCAGGGVTYIVTYDGNDETGGSVPTDATSYSYGGTVTVLGNTGSLAKTNYSFVGWTTNDDGTGSSYVADNTFSITDNTTLYAKWTQAVTFDANTANHGSTGGSATAVWNATGLTGITHATPASGYKLLGYYTAPTSGTKVLNSDGSFANTAVTDYITDGKWSRTGAAPTLYAQYEAAGGLTWNLSVNTTATSLATSSKTSAFTEIAVANMTDAAVNGVEYEKSQKSSLTGKISTPASYDADKYVYVTFQVASGYKFTPSSIKVIAQPVTTEKDVKLSLTDESSHSLVSSSATSIGGGKTKTVELAGDETYFTGTVTLKIYCYGATEKYRLGTPITIEGEVEATCATLPSYTSMSYTTLDYTIGDEASAISIVGGTNINTYAWKQNTTNDRSGGSAASGTNNTASYTPPTSSEGTTYYWCEMTNTSCGLTIKSSAVAVTVSAELSDPTVTWDDPASTPNYGGGGYVIKATVNETDWSGTLEASMLAAPAGIRIYDVTTGTTSSKKWIQAYFDIQTTFDRSTYSSTIPFTLSLPETNYAAKDFEENVAYNNCSADGEGTSYNISVRKNYTKVNNKYYWDNEDGWISPDPSNSIGSSKSGTKMGPENVFDSIQNSNGKYVNIRTYRANINKVRIYAQFRAAGMTVENVYKHNDFFSANAKYEVDYSVVYNGDDEASALGATDSYGYVDITLNELMAANDILLVKFNDSKVRPLGAVLTESSAGSLTTTLGWKSGKAPTDQSGWDGTNSKLIKTQSAANFTCAAEPITANTNTLGTITYSSSNTSCATVNATTGEVTITATGTETLSTTITATLAASGCYKKATLSYTLEVTGQACDIVGGTLALTSGSTPKCSTADVTLTLSGQSTDGTTVTWYRDEIDVTASVSDGALTTSAAGNYRVVVTKDACSVSSNTVAISNYSASSSAEKIVDSWYIKNGRVTPDIALWELGEGSTYKSVAWSPSNATGLDFTVKEGVVYLEGKEPSSNETGADIVYTLTLTVKDACNTENTLTEETITITHQKNTDKHVLAFVVTGTQKGGWTAGISADQTTNVPLYNEIAKNFDVLATNIYSTDDEKKIKEYYSQFDILCVTDYPNTGTKGVNKKSYVDALGALIDIRPILTMEAFVAKLANWKAKGVSGTPKSPSERQYSMLLQCKDHEIFAGCDLTKVGEGDETMYRISMVDNTKEAYVTLDGYTPGSKEYKAGDNPALQGFTYTSDLKDMLPLGLIDDGAGNDLQVGIERQEEMEARLLVLGINSYAMERLTDDGETVVINALKYLMKKNAEDISDCSTYFVGGAEGDEDNWENTDNWSGNALPDKTQKVRILSPCVIKDGTSAHVAGVLVVPNGKYNHGADDATGSLTIEAGGTLLVDGQIEKAQAPYYYEAKPTDPSNLILNTSASKQSALIFDNADGETQATVNIYSKANKDGSTRNWQYLAIPIQEASVSEFFYGVGTYTYKHIEAQGGWVRYGLGTTLNGFDGIGLTQPEAECQTYTFYGPLVDTDNHRFYPTYANEKESKRGTNIVGNSWTAPINLLALAETRATDMVNLDLDIAIYNTGKDKKTDDAWDTPASRTEAGTWEHIPLTLAGEYDEAWLGAKVIPAYQAFQIKATAADAMLNIDYERCVRNSVNTDHVNDALRAPARRGVCGDDRQLLRIAVQDTIGIDYIYLIEGPEFTEGYDNGWEAAYSKGITFGKLYALDAEANKKMALARPDLEGTMVGFVPGVSNKYIITFNQTEGYYYLNDLKKEESTLIQKGNSYTFTVEEGDAAERFMISGTPFVKTNPTGVEEMENGKWKMENVRKVIYNDHLYIIRGGRIYGADGATVK